MNQPIPNQHIKPALIMAALLLSAFTGLLNETALNMAYTEIIADFQISTATAQWLTTGFLLVMGILVPLSAYLNQTYTTRQLYITALSLLSLGTFVAALAPAFSLLLLARIIQASGLGILMPLMINILLLIFPPKRRGTVMGIMSLVILCGPAFGPSFSGFITEYFTWHYIFWTTLPIFLLLLAFGWKVVQNVTVPRKLKFDIPSFLLSSLGFGGIVFGFSIAGEGSGEFVSTEVILPILIGFTALIIFSKRQFKIEQPLLNLRVLKYPMYVFGLFAVFVGHMIIMSQAILLPMFLKTGLAITGLIAGLILLPAEACNGIMSVVIGRLMDKYGPKWLVIPGFALLIVTTFLFSGISRDISIAAFILLHIGLIIGVTMISSPSQTNGLNQLPRKYYPDGTAIVNTLMQIAGALGTAVSVSLLTKGQHNYMISGEAAGENIVAEALIAGVQYAFSFLVVITIIGFIASLFIKRVNV